MFKEEKLIWDITNRPIKGPDDDSGTLPQSAEIGAVSDAKLTPLVDDLTDDILGVKDKSHDKSESATSKIDKKEVISDQLKPPIDYIDPKTGYKVRIYVGEAGFDGTLDVYLPGDTMSIDSALSTKPKLLPGLKAKIRSGKKCALAIVEGSSAAIKGVKINKETGEKTGALKNTRYNEFARPGAFTSLIGNLSSKLDGGVKNVNLIGHSRGGSGIDKILGSGDLLDRITTISCLDSTYWDASKLIKHARRGGGLNVAFTLTKSQKSILKEGGSLYSMKNKVGETVSTAMKVVKALDLKEVSKYHWKSDDGKVNVVCDLGLDHRGIAQTYVAPFMGASVDGDGSVSPLISEKQLAQQIEYNGEHLDEFLTKLDELKKDPAKMQEFLDWAAKQSDMDILRRANVLFGDNIKDHYLKHLHLAAAFLQKGSEVDGHAVFDVNFQGNDLAEWNIGAGHVLPFNVKAIRVYGKGGSVLFDYAERKVVDGEIGYFVPGTGQYAYIHTGFKIEVLGARVIPAKEVDSEYAEFKAEKEVFAKDGERFVIQDYLQRYFKDKVGIDIEVDSQYVLKNLIQLKEVLSKSSSTWFDDYLSEKFVGADFEKVFAEFFDKNIVVYQNIMLLAKQDKDLKVVTLSDLEVLRVDDKFKKLGEKELSEEELVEFKAKDLEGKELSEFVESSPELIQLIADAAKIAKERNPASFVDGHCEQAVRQVASRAIELATGKPIGSTERICIRYTNVDQAETKRLRGKKVKQLTMDDFRGMKPGLAIYIASPTKYAAMGIDIKPGTSGKVHVKKDTDRHWVMWDGVGFTDNHGAARSLGDLKRLVGGKGRIIVNVHDPLGQYGAYV